MKISFSAQQPTAGAIIVPIVEDDLSPLASLNAASGDALTRATKAANFSGKAGKSLTVPGPSGLDDAVVVLMGLGKASDVKASDLASLGGKALQLVKAYDTAAILLDHVSVEGAAADELAAQIAFGARLRHYDFDIYRKKTAKPEERPLEAFAVISAAASAAQTRFDDLAAVAEGVELARDLVSEPPNVLHPESFAERCQELAALGVTVTVLDEEKMAELGMGSLLGVGQGSVRGSRLVAMHWAGGPKGEAPVAFIGKGVTFDTGGISIKPSGGMEDMKFDMGGAAAVTGVMHALAKRKAAANVVGLIGLVENMPDGNAQRPSDIVTSMSGQTIEVLNTDAEGRLVLADVVTYCQKEFQPKAMVDLATLTGAILVSLAYEYGGLFTKDDTFAEALLSAGKSSGEPLWRMPLDKAHDDMIKSDIADMKNIGGRWGGSSSAAAFIARFVEGDTPWAHLDIAGMAWAYKDQDICPKGGTGYGVRLLDALVRAEYETNG